MRNVSWQQVALVAVILAGVILANRYAPGVVAGVAGVVAPVITWFLKAPSFEETSEKKL